MNYADSLKAQYKNKITGVAASGGGSESIRLRRLVAIAETGDEGGTGIPSRHNHLSEKYHPKSGTHCWYCDRPFYLVRSARFRGVLQKTIEHIRPKSKGGSNSILNQISCCNDCNNLKGNKTLKDFIWFLRFDCKEMKEFRRKMITRCYKLHNKRKKFF
jgi:hypothetical protein